MIVSVAFVSNKRVCSGFNKVDQHTRIQSAFEGDSVTINCTYQTTVTNPTLFWYQQKVSGIPKYMLNKFSKSGNSEEEFKERFHANLSTTSVPLTIQDVRVSDSAVYYCALRPTVTETLNTHTRTEEVLIFVNPHIKPTIYNSHNIITLVETPVQFKYESCRFCLSLLMNCADARFTHTHTEARVTLAVISASAVSLNEDVNTLTSPQLL
uniref:Ig-like domain-containing protein n=1 Tax=Cyprinus carpio TaxID=7962 RepID=A0A8C2I6C3_CYPCA